MYVSFISVHSVLRMCMCVCMCLFVCNRLVTKVFIGKLPDGERDHGQTNQLHDVNWGALDHAPRMPP